VSVVASELLIRSHAKRLKLPAVAASAERLAAEAAAAGHGPLEFLAALLGAEVAQQEANVERARIQAARFSELKELADFDFSLVSERAGRRASATAMDRDSAGRIAVTPDRISVMWAVERAGCSNHSVTASSMVGGHPAHRGANRPGVWNRPPLRDKVVLTHACKATLTGRWAAY
jgi:hypothetical protein